MSYVIVALGGVLVAVAGTVMCLILARQPDRQQSKWLPWLAMAITVTVLFGLTAIFDNLMIWAQLFHYAPERLSGLRVSLAPLEDFSYPLAVALLLPALWIALQRGGAQRRRDFVQILLSSRPVSWINTAFPFGAAYLLVTREIDWVFLIGVCYFLVPYNLAMYGINDVFDYASDLANPRKGGIEGVRLLPRLHRPMLWLAAATNVPFIILLALAGNPATWVALAISLCAVIAYSAPKLRFKERPVLDSVTSSIHFVSPAVVGLTLGGAAFEWPLGVALGAFFLWGMAAHAFGAIQDIDPDREAGIHSIATAFGARTTARLSLALWAAAGALMLFTPWPGPLAAIIAVPYLLNCAPFWRVGDDTSARTNRAWRRFIALNYFSGFFATLILIIEWNQV